jgi:hypothetical protein
MKKAVPTICSVLLPAIFAAAASASSDITYIHPGARPNALGTAFSSVADDPYTIFYNPAGLMHIGTIENRFGLARRVSPLSPVGEASFAYSRPVPDTKYIAGLGYYAIRQNKIGSMDTLVAGLGSSFILKYLQRPVLYGGSLKLISLRDPEKSHFGIGAEGGLIFSSNMGLRTALTLSDLVIGLGRSLTTITLGNSYRLRDTLFTADLKVRGSYSELFYGMEHSLFNNLLQFRAGKGVALNGPGYLALGLGFNATPWIIDFTASIPWKGFYQEAGLYEVNVGYRFDSPTFTESFVGDAGARAGTFRTQVDDLRSQKASLESSISTYRANKGVLESDLTMMQSRRRELENRLKDLELQIIEAEHRKQNPKPAVVRIVIPKPEKWPKLHRILPGETLRSLASLYYGTPTLWERIYDANQKNISRGLPIEGSIFEIPSPPAKEK